MSEDKIDQNREGTCKTGLGKREQGMAICCKMQLNSHESKGFRLSTDLQSARIAAYAQRLVNMNVRKVVSEDVNSGYWDTKAHENLEFAVYRPLQFQCRRTYCRVNRADRKSVV